MSDIRLEPSEGLSFDLAMEKNDLSLDDALKSAVVISLFTDRRVSLDELPEGDRDRRGWWADALNEDDDHIGSKLWTLKREKITPEILDRFKHFCEEALQWLINDRIAESVVVFVERSGLAQISIGIEIKRPQNDRIKYRYSLIWGKHGIQ